MQQCRNGQRRNALLHRISTGCRRSEATTLSRISAWRARLRASATPTTSTRMRRHATATSQLYSARCSAPCPRPAPLYVPPAERCSPSPAAVGSAARLPVGAPRSAHRSHRGYATHHTRPAAVARWAHPVNASAHAHLCMYVWPYGAARPSAAAEYRRVPSSAHDRRKRLSAAWSFRYALDRRRQWMRLGTTGSICPSRPRQGSATARARGRHDTRWHGQAHRTVRRGAARCGTAQHRRASHGIVEPDMTEHSVAWNRHAVDGCRDNLRWRSSRKNGRDRTAFTTQR